MAERIASVLAGIVGHAHVLTAGDDRAPHEVDWTGRFRGATPAVVRPGSLDEVAAVVDVCRAEGIALVPQGGNTGLVGGGVPLHGEVVVSLRRLTAVSEVDVAAQQVTAQAGATVEAVQQAAAAAGLRYAVDLGSRGSATVGGTVATNAGGLHVIRHGGTRQQVMGVQAVLGSGAVVDRLDGLVKDNTGYHLPSLLCGSEGTLGLVTAARLRLVPRYEQVVTALVGFASAAHAVAAVTAWRQALDTLEAVELMLHEGVALVCRTFDVAPPFDRPWPVLVLVEAAAHHDPTDDLAAAVGAADGVGDVAVAVDEARRAQLWRYREAHTLAINTLGPPHKLDVTVPVPRIPDLVAEVPARLAAVAPDATAWLFGHAGDGNVHVNVTGLAPDDERAEELVFTTVLGMGGSISAEHGIGTAKRRWMTAARSAGELAAMRAVKTALDPDGICNPHVLLP